MMCACKKQQGKTSLKDTDWYWELPATSFSNNITVGSMIP